jgi:3',5'-cyclic AMP phosphodiesterase CpdA
MAAGARANSLAECGMVFLARRMALLLIAAASLIQTHSAVPESTRAARVPPLYSVSRGPYLQLETSSSVVIRWRTQVYCEGFVVYGTNWLDMKHVAWTQGIFTEHVVLLKDLTPGTRYFYSLGAGTNQIILGPDRDLFFCTAPVSGTPKATRVWVLGDPGTRTAKETEVRDAYYRFNTNRYTDACLLLGDNAYPAGTDLQYQAGIFAMYRETMKQTCLWPALGNHDTLSASSETQSGVYFDIFTLPTQGQAGGVMSGTEAYYSFENANIHFIALDSDDSPRQAHGAMANWLRRDLAANRQKWLVAYWHHPPFTKGGHDSDIDKSDEKEMREMRENILPILEGGGVDLVMCGHSHSYERSYLIDGFYGTAKSFLPSFIKNSGDGQSGGNGPYLKSPGPHGGTVYVVAGSSGQTSGGPLKHPVMFKSMNELGSMVLDFNGNRLDAIFLDATGKKRDEFSIVKQ